MQATLDALRPTGHQRIYDLVREAGVPVGFWEVSKETGRPIDPYTNTYWNSQWTFGGGSDPLVACIWWTELEVDGKTIVRRGNSKANAADWIGRIASLKSSHQDQGANRLRPKINKARAFDQLMSEAFRKRKPVRVVVLDGDRASAEQAEYETSVASRRCLDGASWYVHQYDPFSGDFVLVRDVPPPVVVPPDPFGGAEDPADAPDFRDVLENSALTETERDALTKMRVGQGWFREELLRRWKGCAVTHCYDATFLIASHIKPWRLCTTRAERLSPDNGLLLTPNLDRLFDQGYITFDQRFRMLISPKLTRLDTQHALGLVPNSQLRIRSFEGMQPFMEFHRETVFVR